MADLPPPTTPPADVQPPGKPWWKRWWGITLIVFAAIVVLGGLGGDAEDEPSTAGAETTSPSEPTEEPTATEPPATAEAQRPATLEDRIAEAIGPSNRDIEPRFTVSRDIPGEGVDELVIRWAINDVLTEGMTKASAKIDATDILEVVATHPDLQYDQVFLVGTFSLVDQLGNVEEDEVVMATYPRDTVEAINFENFLHDNVWNIANQESLFIHPAFQE